MCMEVLGLTFYELLWYFAIYSFLGWCMEVVFCTVRTGKLVNRGFLNGPVCPIYGFGMVIVLAVLGRFSDNVALLFFGGMALTSALELAGGWALKRFFHTTWWDYSDKPMNLAATSACNSASRGGCASFWWSVFCTGRSRRSCSGFRFRSAWC